MPLYSQINDRLNELVGYYTNGNATSFARNIGIVQQKFDRLLRPSKQNGKYPIVKPEVAEAILSKYDNINRVWLLSGIGQMLNDPEFSYNNYPSGMRMSVPYYNLDFVSQFCSINVANFEETTFNIDFLPCNQADFWCNVTGHSMEPKIGHGDIIALRELQDIQSILNGEIYGLVTKDFCTVKHIVYNNKDQTLVLIPANKSVEYTEQIVPTSKVERVFAVLGCFRKL